MHLSKKVSYFIQHLMLKQEISLTDTPIVKLTSLPTQSTLQILSSAHCLSFVIITSVFRELILCDQGIENPVCTQLWCLICCSQRIIVNAPKLLIWLEDSRWCVPWELELRPLLQYCRRVSTIEIDAVCTLLLSHHDYGKWCGWHVFLKHVSCLLNCDQHIAIVAFSLLKLKL